MPLLGVASLLTRGVLMRIMSYNVNGIRARVDHLRGVLEQFQPHVIGLQEIKVADEDFPEDVFSDLGYHMYRFGQKGHYGVALFSREPADQVQYGFPGDGEEEHKRMIAGVWSLKDGRKLHVVNGYYPQGDNREHPTKFPNKRRFYENIQNWVEQQYKPDDLVVLTGDMNIAPVNNDIGIGEPNVKRWLKTGKASFLPEEREWLARLMDWGFHDTWREQNPDTDDIFSWFDYRSRGFEREPRRGLRIDLILASKPLMAACDETGIDYEWRSRPKSSDHCAIWADFDI